MKAIQVTEFGGPEVLQLADVPDPEAGDGQVLVKVTRAGINFADTHQRQNDYLAPAELPMIPGAEVAGVVAADGAGFSEGQRVVAMPGTGGYAEYAAVPGPVAFPVPDGVDDGTALALVLQGLTAWHLLRTSAKMSEGETVVVHAAGGGVGSLAVQLAKAFGAGRIIATASTAEKRDLALELGADAAIDVKEDDLNAALREANEGKKVDVVLEMAGGAVFDGSLRALAPFGRLVAYGMASREAREVANGDLMRGSKAVVGFWLMHCIGREDMTREPLEDLFARAGRGELRAIIGGTYPMSDVRRAHEDIQGRGTTGKLLLDPTA